MRRPDQEPKRDTRPVDMQDRKLALDPHMEFRQTIASVFQQVGVTSKQIYEVLPAVERAAHQMNRDISARAGVAMSQEDYEKQAEGGEVGPPPISANAIDNKRRARFNPERKDPDGFDRRRGW